jgi:hypothetical protein
VCLQSSQLALNIPGVSFSPLARKTSRFSGHPVLQAAGLICGDHKRETFFAGRRGFKMRRATVRYYTAQRKGERMQKKG